jgi:1-acyl-sn-glycerol-3-phosphate acyltransferase
MAEKKLPLGYRVVRSLFRTTFRLLADVDARGLERVPMEGGALLAANHMTFLEGPLVFGLVARHPLTALAKQEFQGTLAGRVVDLVNPIYVARGEVDRKALKEMMQRLKEGAAIGIAPEGTRSKTGRLMEGKEGAAYLAFQTGAWVVPVAVWGQEQMLAQLKRFRRPKIHLRIGEPFRIESEPGKARGEILAAGTERIMHAIARMLPPEYRGAYADEVQGPPQW